MIVLSSIVFNSNQLGDVRVIMQDGEPWFVGKDVAEILGYTYTANAIRDNVDKEDKQIVKNGAGLHFEIPTRGLTIINESGLYSLILSSKLPSAKAFKRWVTSEVLPAIRNIKHTTATIQPHRKQIGNTRV